MGKRKRVKRLPKHKEQREWPDITEKSGFDMVVIMGEEGEEIGFMPVSKSGKNFVKNMVHAPKSQWRGRAFYWPYGNGMQLFHMMYFSLPLTVGIIDQTKSQKWTEDISENPRRRRNRWPPERMPKKKPKIDFQMLLIYDKGEAAAIFTALSKKAENFLSKDKLGRTIPCVRNDDGNLETPSIGGIQSTLLAQVLAQEGYVVNVKKGY